MNALKDKDLYTFKGKMLAGRALDEDDVNALFDHIEALTGLLDEGDGEDAFGTEGWRHRLGIDE